MDNTPNNQRPLVFSYLALRKAIGYLGIALPFVVSLGAGIIFHKGIQNSISAYYHTGMRDVFVGTLWAIGFFLLSYKGYDERDDIAGTLGCVFAVCMSLFRTAPDGATSGRVDIIGVFHWIFAALLFLTLIYFSLFLFTKTHADRAPTKQKLRRNKVFRTCGYAMTICIGLIGIHALLPDDAKSALDALHPVYWLEAIAVEAFGISWMTKGAAILKDEVLSIPPETTSFATEKG